MAALTWSDVTNVAKNLDTVPVPLQNILIAFVEERVDPLNFKGEDSETFLLARSWLAAHLATLWTFGALGPTGPVTSESEGGVSTSYAFINFITAGMLTSTVYGRNFALLSRLAPGVAGAVT